jgi:hypothetical protein
MSFLEVGTKRGEHKERMHENEHGGYILYSYMKIEE